MTQHLASSASTTKHLWLRWNADEPWIYRGEHDTSKINTKVRYNQSCGYYTRVTDKYWRGDMTATENVPNFKEPGRELYLLKHKEECHA